MKKLIVVFALTLTLAGCAGMPKSLLDGGTSILVSTENPITRERLYQIEAGLNIATSGALTYRRSCLSGVLPPSCRAIVEKIRPMAALARRSLLPRLRAFVRQNDQVNAIKVFFELKGLVDDLRATAAGAI